MKNKKFTVCVVGAAILANIVMFAVVNATSDTEAVQQVTAGTRTIVSYDSSITFGATSVSFSDATTTAAYTNGIEWIDLNGRQAYSINPDLTGHFGEAVDGDTFSMGGLSLRADATEITTVDGRCGFGTADRTFRSFDALDGSRTSGVDFVHFYINPGVGRCRVVPELALVVPADTAAGTYRTTLSWTLS